jgi:hypothetical protein
MYNPKCNCCKYAFTFNKWTNQTIEFKAGQTLADLVIEGQNIKWYLNQNPLAGKQIKNK